MESIPPLHAISGEAPTKPIRMRGQRAQAARERTLGRVHRRRKSICAPKSPKPRSSGSFESLRAQLKCFRETLELTDEEFEEIQLLYKEIKENKRAPEDLYTVREAIIKITDPKFTEIKFFRSIMSCIPAIANANLVLAYFFAIYYGDSTYEPTVEVKKRVITILSFWVRSFPSHFNRPMQRAIVIFTTLEETKEIAEPLFPIVRKMAKSPKKIKPLPLEEVTYTHPIRFVTKMNEVGVQIIAQQLAIANNDLFSEFNSKDAIIAIYKDERPESLQNYTRHFEVLAGFVSLTVIFYPTVAERAEIFLQWVRIALFFRTIKDFFGLFAVITGLTNKSVSRLSQTIKAAWKKSPELKPEFTAFVEFCDFSSDFKTYRDAVASAHAPIVPFLGCFQRDWIYINEMLPARKDGRLEQRRIDRVVEALLVLERMREPFPFKRDEGCTELIAGIKESPDTIKLMQISMLREPPAKSIL